MNQRVVLLDLGNVLFHYDPQLRLSYLSQISGHSVDAIAFALSTSELVTRLDDGSAGEDELVHFISGLTQASTPVSECWRIWFMVFTPNQDLWQLLPLLAQHFCLGILSNNPAAMHTLLKAYTGINNIFLSGQLGVMKPSAQIYQRVQQHLDVQGGAICLVDDNSKNLEAAAAQGWRTIEYSSHAPVQGDRLVQQLIEVFAC